MQLAVRAWGIAFTALLAFVMTVAAPAAGKPGQRPSVQAVASPEQMLRWINGYRHAPEPKRLAEAVRAMSRMGLFRDPETAGVYIGFIAGVIGSAPAEADKRIASLFPMPPEEQIVVVKAIAFSGLADWKAVLGRFAERMPARRVVVDRYLTGKMQPLLELPLDSGPLVLDALWGYFFATGSEPHVMRIVGTLAWAGEKKDLEKLTAAGMAKWTLAANASRDQDLLSMLRRQMVLQPTASRGALKDLVDAVEIAETSRIRRDALAAIDDLKRRTPVKPDERWTWSAIAHATSTVIALGCVAASVTGQVELGIPCIIGGAVTQGAGKLLSLGGQ
jgi:hypothetical protein